MSDECVAHILRERENSVVVGLGTSHSEAAVLPINVAWRKVGDLLHAESEPQTQKQESPIPSVLPLLSPAGGKKRTNLLVGEIFRQTRLAVTRDFWQGGVPTLRNSPAPGEIPQHAAHDHQPSSLGVTARQSCELSSEKAHNLAETKLLPIDISIWKLQGEEPAKHIPMQIAG
jgi:hypothetical protein